MYYAYKYRLKPSDAHREELDRHRDICRQLYNHTLSRLNEHQDEHGELPSMTTLRSELPDLKKWWDGLLDVYSKVLQTVVERLFDNLNGLSKLKENGYGVGQLKWKPPREFRSFTYSQSGFKLDKKGGQTVLSLSKLADIPIRLHRAIPDDAKLKQVTVKKEPTGEWFATFGVQMDREPPETPESPEKCVGIDVGILKYAHDTDGTAVGSLDLSDDVTAWNASNGSSRANSTGRTTTRSNGGALRSVTPTSDGSAATSCTNSRTTTLRNTTS